MKNYIVIHNLNGKKISRSDFGEDFESAKDYAKFVANYSYQTGKHQILLIEENSPLSNKFYSESFIL